MEMKGYYTNSVYFGKMHNGRYRAFVNETEYKEEYEDEEKEINAEISKLKTQISFPFLY